jgi:hypothetical protein
MLKSLSWDYHPYYYSKSWQKLHDGQTGIEAEAEEEAAASMLFVQRNQAMAHGVAN